MKLSSYSFFIKKRNHSNIRMHVISYLITLICFGLLCFIISFPWIFNRAYRDVDRLLPTGLDNCAVIDFKSTLSNEKIVSATEEGRAFIVQLLDSEEIFGIGDYIEAGVEFNLSYDGTDYSTTMFETSRVNEHNILRGDLPPGMNLYDTVAFSYHFKDFYNFDLYKGDFDIQEELENGDYILYLGYNFRDIPIGACETKYNPSFKRDITYRVAGIIDKGEEILNVKAAATNFMFDASYGYNLDNMIIMVLGKTSENDVISLYGTLPVSFAEGTSFEDGISKIKEIADKNGITVSVQSMRNKLQVQLSQYDDILNAVALVSPISFLVTAMILLTVQLLFSVMRNDEIGVWLSNGMTRKEVFLLLLLDNMKKLVLSAIIGAVASDLFLCRMLNLTGSENFRIFGDVYIYGPLCAIGLAVITALVISILSYLFICGKSLPDIIKNADRRIRHRKFFKSSSIFSFLFMISFVVCFIIMYYGLYLYREYSDIRTGKSAFKYAVNYDITLMQFSKDEPKPDLNFSKGNLYEKIRLPISSTEYGDRWGYLVTRQNEAMLETIDGGNRIGIVGSSDVPLCAIGDRWLDNVYIKNGEKYIKIFDTEVKVIGILDRTSFEGKDKRFFIFESTLSPEIMLKWFGYGYNNDIFEGMMTYVCSDQDSDIDLLEKQLTEAYGENSLQIIKTNGFWSANEDEIRTYTSFMKIVIGALSVLCVFNMLFLSVVWSRAYSYEFMVKRIFGYKIIRLLPDIFKTMIMYEVPAVIISMLFTLLFETIFRNADSWIRTISNGFFLEVVIFIGIAIILSAKPLFWISKANPADYVCRRVE